MLFRLFEAAADGSTDALQQASMWPMLIGIVLMFVIMYFVVLRPNKKKEKKAAEMRNSIEIGDEITTIGGIIGRVVIVKEDTFVIETAGDRSKIRFKRWAIQDVEKLNMEGEIEAGESKLKPE